MQPVVDRIEAQLVATSKIGEDDVPLTWNGAVVAGVRLPGPTALAPASIGDLIDVVEGEVGSPLAQLGRPGKQRAVRLLEECGPFTYRKAAETVAQALGVSRFPVYNYLNRDDGTA